MPAPGSQRGKVSWRRLGRRCLAAALLLAFALRVVGLRFAADTALTPRSDEEIIRLAVLHSLTGDPNPHYAVWGHLFHNIYLFGGLFYTAVVVTLGGAQSWVSAIARAHVLPAEFVVLGRFISVLAGSLTVVPTYQLARRVSGSPIAGLAAAFLLATAFLHVRDSHFATTDILATCLYTVGLAAMCHPAALACRRAAFFAGLISGAALAAKLSTAPLIPTFATLALLGSGHRSDCAHPVAAGGLAHAGARRRPSGTLGLVAVFLVGAALAATLLQPFLLLDPMQTIFGIFGDILGPARRPFVGGLDYRVPAVMARYYVPQALGWWVGGLALLGALATLVWPRRPRERWLLVAAFWMILPLVTVRQTYLRYMNPLLPLASVFAGLAIDRAVRGVRGWLGRPHVRAGAVGMLTALVCAPNLWRDVLLDQRLCRADTRGEAKRWIEAHVPANSRILWFGFGSLAPHLAMPWLHATERYDREVMEVRRRHGLSNAVEEEVLRWKIAQGLPTYDAVAASPLRSVAELPGYVRFPFERRFYDVPILRALDAWGHRVGLLNDQTPYGELMRRYLAGWSGLDRDAIAALREEWVAVARMPPHADALGVIGPQYELVQSFSPGWRAAPDDERSMLYDWGDAWWLPNLGLAQVERPGPEIHIFRLRAAPRQSGAGRPPRGSVGGIDETPPIGPPLRSGKTGASRAGMVIP